MPQKTPSAEDVLHRLHAWTASLIDHCENRMERGRPPVIDDDDREFFASVTRDVKAIRADPRRAR